MPKIKGTFSKGWWNCFESFAATSNSVENEEVCMTVLREAGITNREADSWLNKPEYHNPHAEQLVKEYLDTL